MSTLRVSNINNASATSGGLAIDSAGVVSGGLPAPNRNLLYNGAMQIAQRGTSVTGITTGDYRTADRWFFSPSFGTWTMDVQADAPTGSGFRNSTRLLLTAGAQAPSAGDQIAFIQRLEGLDVQRIAKGTTSAQQLTLSFWVKSNVTGTFVVRLNDPTNSRDVSAGYSINVSAAWEKKTLTFPADTTGVLNNDNSLALVVNFALSAGSNFTSGTLNTSWGPVVSANRFVGQTNLAASTNNYWQITGVQLEVGPTATPFEFKSYQQELAECQRYYISYGGSTAFETVASAIGVSGTVATANVIFPVEMRTTPSALTTSGNWRLTNLVDSSPAITSFTLSTTGSSSKAASFDTAAASGITAKVPFVVQPNNSTASRLAFSAEL